MLLTSLSLLSTNPLIDERKSIMESSEISKEQQYVIKDSFFDLKRTYCYVNNKETKVNMLRGFLQNLVEQPNQEEVPLNLKVVNNTTDFIDTLSTLIVEEIDMNNIYSTGYSTIVIDFEREDSLFSLELGVEQLGYFLENNGVDEKFNDYINYSEIHNSNLIEDLSNFLAIS
jgi:hypothetical protein